MEISRFACDSLALQTILTLFLESPDLQRAVKPPAVKPSAVKPPAPVKPPARGKSPAVKPPALKPPAVEPSVSLPVGHLPLQLVSLYPCGLVGDLAALFAGNPAAGGPAAGRSV